MAVGQTQRGLTMTAAMRKHRTLYHARPFSGIGGTLMGSLAAKELGFQVSGSDKKIYPPCPICSLQQTLLSLRVTSDQ